MDAPKVLTNQELLEFSALLQAFPPDHPMVRMLSTINLLLTEYRQALEVLEGISSIRLLPYSDDGGAVDSALNYISSLQDSNIASLVHGDQPD